MEPPSIASTAPALLAGIAAAAPRVNGAAGRDRGGRCDEPRLHLSALSAGGELRQHALARRGRIPIEEGRHLLFAGTGTGKTTSARRWLRASGLGDELCALLTLDPGLEHHLRAMLRPQTRGARPGCRARVSGR